MYSWVGAEIYAPGLDSFVLISTSCLGSSSTMDTHEFHASQSASGSTKCKESLHAKFTELWEISLWLPAPSPPLRHPRPCWIKLSLCSKAEWYWRIAPGYWGTSTQSRCERWKLLQQRLDLVGGNPAYGRALELDDLESSFQSKQFYDSVNLS